MVCTEYQLSATAKIAVSCSDYAHHEMQVPLSSLRTCTYALLYAEGLVQLLSKGTVCSCQAVMLQAGLI